MSMKSINEAAQDALKNIEIMVDQGKFREKEEAYKILKGMEWFKNFGPEVSGEVNRLQEKIPEEAKKQPTYLDQEQIYERKTDDRGRFKFPAEHSEKELKVAILSPQY